MDRETCLRTAQEVVCVGREVAHGSPEDTFGRIARLWTAYLQHKAATTGLHVEISEIDVALMMDLVKTARLQHNPAHVDSWVDKVGYAACGCEIGTRGRDG